MNNATDLTKTMVGFAVVHTVLGFASISTNCLVIFVIVRGQLWKKCHFYLNLLCMAIGALAYAIEIFIVSGVIRAVEILDGSVHLLLNTVTQTQCGAVVILILFGHMYYQYIMLLVSCERFYAIVAPMHYRLHAEAFTKYAILIITICCIAVPLGGLIGTQDSFAIASCTAATGATPTYFTFYSLCFWILPGLLSMLLYAIVWIASLFKTNNHQQHLNEAQRQRHKAITHLVTTIIIVYSLTSGIALPILASVIFLKGWSQFAQAVLSAGCAAVVAINHILDLFVYSFRCEEIRAELRKITKWGPANEILPQPEHR